MPHGIHIAYEGRIAQHLLFFLYQFLLDSFSAFVLDFRLNLKQIN